MLPHDLNHIAQLQAGLALYRAELEGRWRHLGQNTMLLRTSRDPPRLANDVAVSRSRAGVLAHGDGTCIAHGFIRAILATTRVVRYHGGKDARRDIVVRDQAGVQLLEVQERVVT